MTPGIPGLWKAVQQHNQFAVSRGAAARDVEMNAVGGNPAVADVRE